MKGVSTLISVRCRRSMSSRILIDSQSPQSCVDDWAAIVYRLQSAEHVTVLTGAGVSAESGLPTFRSGGLWESHRFEDVATPEAFARDPELVWRFYNYRRELLSRAKPNAAHAAIRVIQLVRHHGFTLVTQNVDGLHQLAGSTEVLELHGSLRRVRCTNCTWSSESIEQLPSLPLCACGSLLRPGVVWFGESLPAETLLKARKAAGQSGVLLVIGTSAVVHPAAGFIEIGRAAGAFVVEVNPADTEVTKHVHAMLRGDAGRMVPELVARWLQP